MDNENILIEWCDVAKCNKWMYMRAHQKYAKYNMWFTIPSIVLSTISGTASFAQTGMTGVMRDYSPIAIGTVNITVGIINTIQQFFKISQLQESHRVACIAWDKFARNIKIELAKKPEERTDAGTFFKQMRNEYDRLMESCPTIPNRVIREFIKEIAGPKGSEQREKYDELIKPEICNTIISSRRDVYKRGRGRERRDTIPEAPFTDKLTMTPPHTQDSPHSSGSSGSILRVLHLENVSGMARRGSDIDDLMVGGADSNV